MLCIRTLRFYEVLNQNRMRPDLSPYSKTHNGWPPTYPVWKINQWIILTLIYGRNSKLLITMDGWQYHRSHQP
jgi:hypothetical protein